MRLAKRMSCYASTFAPRVPVAASRVLDQVEPIDDNQWPGPNLRECNPGLQLLCNQIWNNTCPTQVSSSLLTVKLHSKQICYIADYTPEDFEALD